MRGSLQREAFNKTKPRNSYTKTTQVVGRPHTRKCVYTRKENFQTRVASRTRWVDDALLLAGLVQKILQGLECDVIRGARGLHVVVVNRHARQISGPTASLPSQTILLIAEGNFILFIGLSDTVCPHLPHFCQQLSNVLVVLFLASA